MMTQKGDPCIKPFSTLSRVRMLSWILSQLNILCTTVVKLYYTNNNDSPVVHHWHVTATLRVVQRIEFHRSSEIHAYNKRFSTLSGVRYVFWSLPQLHILCTSAVKQSYDKNYNWSFTCHLFSSASEFMEAKKTCHRVVRTSVWLISYSGELCNKNYISKTSETLITWSTSCYTDGSE